MRKWVFFSLIGVLFLFPKAYAGSTDVPRILLVGDSWGSAMQIMRSFEMQVAGIGQHGNSTTLVGVLAAEFDSPEWMAAIQAELNAYPTIDIIHLSLGGNDFLNESHWTKDMPAAEIEAFMDQVNAHIANVIDNILAMRPNLRIAVCGYDFVNHHMGDATPTQINAIWSESEHRKLEMVLTKPRTFFIHNLGLMHYYFGTNEAGTDSYTTPLPGGYADNYLPFPGGNPDFLTPKAALLDGDIHLNMYGYDKLAERCLNEFYNTWLSWPVVYEILPLESGSAQSRFRVTFNKPVSGVDSTDFSGGGASTVTAVTGSGAVYEVTLALNGEAAPGHLSVVDDDTITGGGLPLGGVGVGNGGFSHNGALVYSEEPMVNPVDFDKTFNSLVAMFQPFAWALPNLDLHPETCDINGGSVDMDSVSLTGNGMLDTAEFGLIQACLDNESLDLSAHGGITHAMAQEAWEHNYARMLSDLGGPSGRLFTMSEGIVSLLAGLMTLGDNKSTFIPGLLLAGSTLFLDPMTGITPINVVNYTPLADYLSTTGDADGDGVSNQEEYDFFMPIGGKALYLTAALDPEFTPNPQCGNTSGGSFTEGTPFCLLVADDSNLAGGFAWYKNGVPLSDTGRIVGTSWRELRISSLEEEDAGSYTCVYDDGNKTFGPVEVRINAVPLTGTAGIIGLVSLLGGMAVSRLRKRA